MHLPFYEVGCHCKAQRSWAGNMRWSQYLYSGNLTPSSLDVTVALPCCVCAVAAFKGIALSRKDEFHLSGVWVAGDEQEQAHTHTYHAKFREMFIPITRKFKSPVGQPKYNMKYKILIYSIEHENIVST